MKFRCDDYVKGAVKEGFVLTEWSIYCRETYEQFPGLWDKWLNTGRNHRPADSKESRGPWARERDTEEWVLDVQSLEELASLIRGNPCVTLSESDGYEPAYPTISLRWDD